MNTNKKLLAVLSVPAVASLLAVAVTTPVKAATRDFYDISTSPATIYANADYTTNADKLNALITAATDHPSQFVYQYGANFYNYKTLFDNYVTAKAQTPTTTVAAAFTSAIGSTTAVPNPTVTKLSVSSVSATNLKTITVNFNKAVDPTTISSSTVKVYDNTSTITDSTLPEAVDSNATASTVAPLSVGYVLSSDNKSLTVIFADNNIIHQSDNVKVAIDGVAIVGGAEKISGYAYNQVVTDTVAPTATGVTFNNAKTFTVSFSKPLGTPITVPTVLSNIKVDGVAVVGTVTPDYVNNKLRVSLPTALSVGSHNVTVTGLADYVGLKTPDATFPITVSSDTTVPSIASAKIIDQGTIDVTFNKDLDPTTLGSYTVNGSPATAQLVSGTTNVVRLILANNAQLNLAAIVETDIAYQGQADVMGNTVTASQTFKFATADDTTAPTVSAQLSTDSASKNTVTLTFSKSMLPATGTITVLDSNGNTVGNPIAVPAAAGFKANTNNTVLVLSAGQLGITSVNAGTYTLDIKNMKDNTLRQNALPETKLAVNAIDTKAPSVQNSVYFVTPGANNVTTQDKITVFFDEAMDTSTLSNLSNYIYNSNGVTTPLSAYNVQINGTTYVASVSSIAADGKSVTLLVPNASSFAGTFGLYSLKDLAGNPLVATNVAKAGVGVTAFNVNSATAIDSKTIKVVLSTPVASLDPSSFKLAVNGVNHTPTAGTAFNFANATVDTTDSTGKTILLTVNGTLNANADYTLEDISGNDTLTKNIYGVSLGTTLNLLTDKIAPSIKSASIEINGDSNNYRAIAMSSDGLTGTIDLSDITSNVKLGKITSSEDSALSLVLPTVSNVSTTLTGVTDQALDLSSLLGVDNGGDGISLSKLQALATQDGDGNDNTLTLTAKLTDDATPGNTSLVKLVIKVK